MGSQALQYNCNGNQLTRLEPTGTYTQAYDSENRLQSVTVNGQSTMYTYDVDGVRVKKADGASGLTTVYVGQHFEKVIYPPTTTTYYFLGGQRVAMKKAGALYYLLTDHLGSTSLLTDADGNAVTGTRLH